MIVRAHHKKAKQQISPAWFRMWLSPVWERATCTNPPEGVDAETWGRRWTHPETSAMARSAKKACLEECPVLMECRAFVSLGPLPDGVIQAGRSFRIRIPRHTDEVASEPTPDDVETEDAC